MYIVKYLINIKADLLKQDNKGRTATQCYKTAWGSKTKTSASLSLYLSLKE